MYNETSVATDEVLPSGTWYTLDGVAHTGTITLQPYTSEILIKTSSQITANAGQMFQYVQEKVLL